MESLMNNPGLYLLPQEIFGLLDRKSLLKCREVCQSWKQFVDDPNQPWRRVWNRKLESTLEAKIYSKEKNSPCKTLFEAWPHWKETCDYFQNAGSLPQIIIFTKGLVKIEAEVMGHYGPNSPNRDLSGICYSPLKKMVRSCEILLRFRTLDPDYSETNTWLKTLKILLSCPKLPFGHVSH